MKHFYQDCGKKSSLQRKNMAIADMYSCYRE